MGNSCHYLSYVDNFVHGELEETERKEFEKHPPGCVECRNEIESLRELRHLLESAYAPSLDETFNYGVINALRSQKAIEGKKEIKIAVEDIVISLATLVVIMILGIQLFRSTTVSSVEMVGTLTNIEKSSLEQRSLSNDQVLELVMRSK